MAEEHQKLYELLNSSSADDHRRGNEILQQMAAMKEPFLDATLETNPASPRYGMFLRTCTDNINKSVAEPDMRRFDNGDYPLPLECLKVDLGHTPLAFCWYRFADRLTAESKAAIQAFYRHASASFLDKRDQISGHNCPIAKIGGLIMAGQILEFPALVKTGYRQMLEYLRAAPYFGLTPEYNSVSYVFASCQAFALMASFGKRPEVRLVGRMGLERRMMEWAIRYHRPTRQIAGPWSRCYGIAQTEHSGPLYWIYNRADQDNQLLKEKRTPQKNGASHGTLYDFPLPEEFLSFFSDRRTRPETVREIYVQSFTYTPNEVDYPRQQTFTPDYKDRSFAAGTHMPVSFDELQPHVWTTTYLHPDYAFGSTGGRARMWGFAEQDHTIPLMCQYTRPGKNPAWGFLKGSYYMPYKHYRKLSSFPVAIGTHVQHEGAALAHFVVLDEKEGPCIYRIYMDYLAGMEELYASGEKVTSFPSSFAPDTVFHFRDGDFFATLIPMPLNTCREVQVRYAGGWHPKNERMEIDAVLQEHGAGRERTAGYVVEVASVQDITFEDFVRQTIGAKPEEQWLKEDTEWHAKYQTRTGKLLEARGSRDLFGAPMGYVDGKPIPRQVLESPFAAQGYRNQEISVGRYVIDSGRIPVFVYTDVEGKNLIINNPYKSLNLTIRTPDGALDVEDISIGKLRLVPGNSPKLIVEAIEGPVTVKGKGAFENVQVEQREF